MICERIALCVVAALPAGAAWAHPGHVDEVAGHSHWLSYGAAGAALVIAAGAIVLAVRRRRSLDR